MAAHHGDEGRNAGGKQWPRDKHGPGHANLNDAWPAKTRPTLRQRPGQGPGARRRGGFPQEGHAAENVAGDQVVGEDGDGTADNPCPGREWIIPEGQPPGRAIQVNGNLHMGGNAGSRWERPQRHGKKDHRGIGRGGKELNIHLQVGGDRHARQAAHQVAHAIRHPHAIGGCVEVFPQNLGAQRTVGRG